MRGAGPGHRPTTTAHGLRDVGLSQPELDDFARRAGVFESIAGIWPISANLTGSDRPERVEVLLASPNYFEVLGAHAALGRIFTTRDEVPGIATVAVISDGLWRRGFAGDPTIIGRTLRIDEDVYEVVGVMPPTFRHPSATLETDVEVWAPSGWQAAPFPPPGYSARFVAAGDRPPRARCDGRGRRRRVSTVWRGPWPRSIRTTTRRASAGRRGSARSPPISSPASVPRWCS